MPRDIHSCSVKRLNSSGLKLLIAKHDNISIFPSVSTRCNLVYSDVVDCCARKWHITTQKKTHDGMWLQKAFKWAIFLVFTKGKNISYILLHFWQSRWFQPGEAATQDLTVNLYSKVVSITANYMYTSLMCLQCNKFLLQAVYQHSSHLLVLEQKKKVKQQLSKNVHSDLCKKR